MAAISTGDLSTTRFREFGGTWGRGWAHSIARPWIAISSPLTHGLSLIVFSYLAGSKSVSAPDTMTNTGLEAIASSSGKKRVLKNC